ncbi:PKD domain-containing protein [Mucilaginibacter rubeus]|uniref:PKD domain-containing protein n=1 Tax=Mucilaginibacter rubeus TaxID=2027860 RepID=A0A5C1HSX0_9SPHI|nr:PKD domain-containing protein [Mucilaginibacter rubeus]QEM09117.1 PKD domain-containing protein [Mucilaginibacter rubeus]
MKIKQFLLLAFCMLSGTMPLFAQKSIVDVNTLNGSASAVIPLEVVKRGGVSIPVNLVYYGGGVKPKDVERNAGIGWSVETGGQVSRQLRGLPDDCKKDNSNATMTGWIYNTNQSKINSFAPVNNGTTCANETTDINYLTANFAYNSDTEPDVFNVSAPGLSCQLIWDQNLSGFRPVEYQDLVITPSYNATTGVITGFTIVNDQGIKYVFSSPELVTMKAVIAAGATINYFKNTYNQFVNGINFYDNWHLTSVTDINGNGVSITYNAGQPRSGSDPIVLYTGGASGSTTKIAQYNIVRTITPQTLGMIAEVYTDGYSPLVTFNWSQWSTGQMVINNVTRGAKIYTFNYSAVYSSGTNFRRAFLRNVYISGCSSPFNYQFKYYNEIPSTGNDYTTSLGDSTTTKVDYWGYYNGTSTGLLPSLIVNPSNSNYARYAVNVSSTVGSDYANALAGNTRTVNASNIIAGSLSKIYYATGGNTTIQYEPNDYLDVPSNTTIQGGGIRVKSITDSAVTSATTMVRNYTYKTSLLINAPSSGKPVTLPQFAFTTPYSGTATGNDYWNYSTIRSETDLSAESHSIMYEYVYESSNGAGSKLTQVYLPAMNWDNGAAPACSGCTTEWLPTINYAARTNCASSYGPVKNYTGSYPFAPNGNYDFERGLPVKETTFSGDQLKVSETTYSYLRTATPFVIPALEIDDNVNGGLTVRAYSKYGIYTSTGELQATQTNLVYDSPGSTTYKTSSVTYAYNTTQHKLIQQSTTNSDGSVLTNNIKYIKDFTTSGTNADVVALNNLKALNINLPVETYQQVTAGGTTKTVSASLTRFGAFAIGGVTSYMPAQSLKFFSADGDAAFTPYQINSGTPAFYSGYVPATNYLTYDYFGNLATVDDAHKHVSTTVTNYLTNTVEATFSNAATGEVGFLDFDCPLVQGTAFDVGTAIPVSNVGHSGNAIPMNSGVAFSKALQKNAQAANYIFSFWANAPVGSVTLTMNLTGISTITKTYAGTGGWKYYSFTIPMSGVPSSFTFGFSNNVNVTVDDILFYPENCEVTTYNYDPSTFALRCKTNTNGISAYYTNDIWGRLLYTYDQDKNLLSRNTYVTPGDQQNPLPLTVTAQGYNLYTGSAISINTSGYTNCTNTGVVYQWNFGDGGTATTSTGYATHTYSATGTYTITLTATSPLYGTQTVTTSVTITTPPPPPTYVVLHYTNYTTSNGSITNVAFNNGSTTINLTGAQLEGYQLPLGTYTITVTLGGGTQYNSSTDSGYGCVYLTGKLNVCRDYDVHNTNTYAFLSSNLTTSGSLYFTVYKPNCANALPQ